MTHARTTMAAQTSAAITTTATSLRLRSAALAVADASTQARQTVAAIPAHGTLRATILNTVGRTTALLSTLRPCAALALA